MDAFTLNPTRVRDISDLVLDARGCVRILPAHKLAATTPQERLLCGVRHGLYGFPTLELVDFLRARIAGRTAIEIGAGHGVLSQALGIPATDNRQQEDEAIQAHYRALGQPTVPYGDHVEKLDAAAALANIGPRSSSPVGSRTGSKPTEPTPAAAAPGWTRQRSSPPATSKSLSATSGCTPTSPSGH
jgi:hypothetical protein